MAKKLKFKLTGPGEYKCGICKEEVLEDDLLTHTTSHKRNTYQIDIDFKEKTDGTKLFRSV